MGNSKTMKANDESTITVAIGYDSGVVDGHSLIRGTFSSKLSTPCDDS